MRKILLPPLLMIICIAGAFAIARYAPALLREYTIPQNSLWDAVAFVLILIGIALPVWGSQTFKRHQTNILPYKDPDSMVTDGPFQFTRNPMYLGMLAVITGFAVFFGTTTGFLFPALFFAVANWWYIPFEESRMAAVFGEAFKDYKMTVRRWL
jgi:protein-S-isoprenylcysteine O-methyltransferase Ste14